MIQHPETYYMDQQQDNPSFSLIISPYYPFIMSFLSRAFEDRQKKSIPENDMADFLQDYLLNTREKAAREDPLSFPASKIPVGSATEILKTWCDQKHRWLLRDRNNLYSLTDVTQQVFNYAQNAKSQVFNSYRAENILDDILHSTHELASNVDDDKERRIHYHEEEIERLKREIEQHNNEIEKITELAEGENVAVYSRERQEEIQNYIKGLLQDLQLEISRYITMTASAISEFFRQAYDASQNADSSDAIQKYIDRLREISNDPKLNSIHLIRDVMADRDMMNRLRQDTVTINRTLHGRRYAYENSIYRQVQDAYMETLQVLDDLNHANRTVNQILQTDNLRERCYIEKLLQDLEFLGHSLRDAFQPGCPMSYLNGARMQFPALDIFGKSFTISPQKKKAPVLGKIQNGRAAKRAPKILKKPFNKKKMKENILACQKRHQHVTLRTLIKEYPITRGIPEIKAYINLLNELGMSVHTHEVEYFLVEDTASKRPLCIIGNVIVLKSKGEDI